MAGTPSAVVVGRVIQGDQRETTAAKVVCERLLKRKAPETVVF